MLVPLVVKLAAPVVAALVPTTAALGLWYLGRRWSLHLVDEEFRQITALAHEAVMATEQQYKQVPKGKETNREKLEFATSSLLERLYRLNIRIDRPVAEEKIEAAVYRLRSQEQNVTGVTLEAEA